MSSSLRCCSMKAISAKNIAFKTTTRSSLTDETIKVPKGAGVVRFKNDWLIMMSDRKLNLRKGMRSLASTLGMRSDIPSRITGLSLPGDFLKEISLSEIGTNNVGVFGTMTKEILRRLVQKVITKNGNATATTSVVKGGAVSAVMSGEFPLDKLPLLVQSENILRELKESDEKRLRDVPANKAIEFTVFKTGKRVKIMSHKFEEEEYEDDDDDGEGWEGCEVGSKGQQRRRRVLVVKENGNFDLNESMEKSCFIKKKHYYFYSMSGGYGKSTVLNALEKEFNCDAIADVSNMVGVSEKAQFLTVDEYSHRTKIAVEQLKAITGGNPSSSFMGNKKSYGRGYRARRDVQLIIASNSHLFEGVGSKYDPVTGRRYMEAHLAKQLFDRFHVIRFDDEKTGALEDGASALDVTDFSYEDFAGNDFELDMFVDDYGELVKRYLQIIERRIYVCKKRGRKRKWAMMSYDDDDDDGDSDTVDVTSVDKDEYLGAKLFDVTGRPLNKDLYRRLLNNLMRVFSWTTVGTP